tara:strand:+ start:155 stop:859 length:705 start_codon:yes stop_codon:yes gene_type:complete
MAISIDTVYQRVQAILNKENRGYISPQEFNLFANQAQLEIFEQYFFDLNQYSRLPKNDTEYSNLVDTINERISKFKKSATLTYVTSYFTLPTDLHKLGTVIYNSTTPVEEIDQKNLLEYSLSPLTSPSTTNPVYMQNIQTTSSVWSITVFPSTITSLITATYVRKPNEIEWSSQVVSGNALYNASTSTNPELHDSEESNLVIKILLYAGISVKAADIAQVADAKETKKITQEKS